jgi:hypothetical protein
VCHMAPRHELNNDQQGTLLLKLSKLHALVYTGVCVRMAQSHPLYAKNCWGVCSLSSCSSRCNMARRGLSLPGTVRPGGAARLAMPAHDRYV